MSEPFKPSIGYLEPMDQLRYVARDCSYVTHRVDRTLDLLYDGDEIVGVHLWGFRREIAADLARIAGPGALTRAAFIALLQRLCAQRYRLRRLLRKSARTV